MIKIAIIGPESTGKSVLAEALREHFGGCVVKEYARKYVEELGRAYTYEDVCSIAKHQIKEQKQMIEQNEFAYAFFDTELIITKVWFEYCYKKLPTFFEEAFEKPYFDFYLLCSPDLEWIPDAVREHGHDRDYFFEWYKNEIINKNTAFEIVSGQGEKRTSNAIAAINNFLRTKQKLEI
jgi:NadR type nicotinamide-nucleotide adenylyltransferase